MTTLDPADISEAFEDEEFAIAAISARFLSALDNGARVLAEGDDDDPPDDGWELETAEEAVKG